MGMEPEPTKPKPRADAGKVCPSCGTAVPGGRSHCPKCDMEVNKMNAFAAAKAAAEARGIDKTEVQARPPVWRRPGVIVGVLLVACAIVGLYAFLQKPPPPPAWTRYPLTKESAVQQLLADIATGKDEGYARAYGLLSPEAKDPTDREEIGWYRQLYHEMYKYFTEEFGEEWLKTAAITEDPNHPDTMIVKVERETLHVDVRQETPKELVGTAGQHYSIMGVQEFPVGMAKTMQSREAQRAIIGSYAGKGALNNLDTVIGARGMGARMSPIQRKLALLPILRNPRATLRATILQAWPLRKDPVVRGRLEEILKDGRYPADVQRTAKEVLDDRVDETDLIAAGVPDS